MFDYRSPITQFCNTMQTEYENGVLKVVQQYGFDVDKEELTKALAYDRGQYDKGYIKAIADFAEQLKWEYVNSIGVPQREINFAVAVIDQVAERLRGRCSSGLNK